VTQKTRTNIKNQPDQISTLCPSLRISGQFPAPIANGGKTAFENGQISNFEGIMTSTLDWVILHAALHHSSTSNYMPNFTEIEVTFCGQTNVHTG